MELVAALILSYQCGNIRLRPELAQSIEYSPEARQKMIKIKTEITNEYGVDIATRVLNNMVRSIRDLEMFGYMGAAVSELFGVDCDYRYFLTEKNYVFYLVFFFVETGLINLS